MSTARLPAIAIGNGRLLVTTDAHGEVLSACWPCIDSPNNVATLVVQPLQDGKHIPPTHPPERAKYVGDTNIATGQTKEGLTYTDAVIEGRKGGSQADMHARKITGPHPALNLYVAPEMDGRPGAQTIYWDEESEALLCFCRHTWMAIGCAKGAVIGFHCGRLESDSSAIHFSTSAELPSERIAFRRVDGSLRIQPSSHDTMILTVFGPTRECVLQVLGAQRSLPWTSIESTARQRARHALKESSLRGWSGEVDCILRRSSLVWDVLTNSSTGGMVAGPDVQSGIASAPGYAAFWARDAAWTMLGALEMGQTSLSKQMLEFSFAVQSPEGLWLHRHHTDFAIASSWGLHQLDETGILLYAMDCYVRKTGDTTLLKDNWQGISKAANFLVNNRDTERGLPLPTVDLWEEYEGYHLYTAASTIAGLRAAASLATKLGVENAASATWADVADNMLLRAEEQFWDEDNNRFVGSLEMSAALPMVDPERPALSATVQSGVQPPTALPQYPNWRDGRIESVCRRHDISTLALAVPFGILPPDDPCVVATAKSIHKSLWNQEVGGLCRYEGDSYGGGNPWPLATLWLAIYEAKCGHRKDAQRMVDWVISHTTSAGLVPEQVHRSEGTPVAAVPLSWSHGMVAYAVSAVVDGEAV